MPAVSKKQQRFFGYLLSNPEERKKKGISKKAAKDFAQDVKEVAPPGWGHTKAEKEKTKPWKPKSKIGGTAAAFKRALDDGRFKGLPGSKTKKEKTADMFKLMWSMKKKGDKPHNKPGTDEKYKKYQDVDEAVKGQDTESRKEGAKERATEKKAHDAWKKRPGTTKRPLYSTTRHTKTVGDAYATQQKQSIKWHDKRTKGKFIPGTTSEDWKPEIEVIDTKKRKKEAEKRRKEAADSLPPHLKLDAMKKAFASSHSDKSNMFTQESLGFTIDSGEHKKASKKAKIRNLAKGNTLSLIHI